MEFYQFGILLMQLNVFNLNPCVLLVFFISSYLFIFTKKLRFHPIQTVVAVAYTSGCVLFYFLLSFLLDSNL